MLNTVVCDDELPALELMRGLLTETGAVSIVGVCQSARDALDLVNRGGVDLVVFDIEMPELSGVDAYSQIKASPRPLVIFATAHPKYAVEAFDVEAIDYILKPLSSGRVGAAIEKALRLHGLIKERREEYRVPSVNIATQDRPDLLKIKDAGKFYFVPHDDIYWVEAAGDYSVLHTKDRDLTVRLPIKKIESELPATRFVRVHRSAIISVAHIREVVVLPKGESQIVLEGGDRVRTSRSYRGIVQQLITR